MFRSFVLMAICLSAIVATGTGCRHRQQCCRTDTLSVPPPPPPVPALYTPPCNNCR